MKNVFLRRYIERRGTELQKPVSNIESRLHDSIDLPFLNGKRIVFVNLIGTPQKATNASALIPGIIRANYEWAARLVLFPDDKTVYNSFVMTMAHEVTHYDGDLFYFDFYSRRQRFVDWVNEVHADFGGALKAFDGDRELAVLALKYKCKDRPYPEKDLIDYPSWNRRIEYLQKWDFGESLIRKIAEDVGCRNNKLIEKVCRHFKPIALIGID